VATAPSEAPSPWRWPLPKVSEQHKDARRQQILDAAMRCFSERGVQRTTLREICRESGLSRGAVYTYFPSKHAIVQGVLDLFDEQNQAMMAQARATGDPGATFRALAHSAFDLFRRDDAEQLLRIDWALKSEALHDEEVRSQALVQMTSSLDMFTDLVRELVAEGLVDPALDPRSVALFFGALHEGFKSFSLMGLEVDLEAFTATMYRLVPVVDSGSTVGSDVSS